MQQLFSEVIKSGIMSVHSGEQLGVISAIITRMDSLKISLFEIRSPIESKPLYLRPSEIRFADKTRFVVDSAHSLAEFDELVRYQHDITTNYSPIGKAIYTQSGKRLGKVFDYCYDDHHYFITKLYAKGTWLQKVLYQSLLIDRQDIVETKRNRIIVKDTLVNLKKTSSAVLPARSKV